MSRWTLAAGVAALALATAACDYPELKRKVAAQEREIVDLRALTDRLAMQVTAARAQAEQSSAEFERAEGGPPPRPATSAGALPIDTYCARLASSLAGSGATVAVRRDRIVIAVPGLFASGKTTLTSDGKALLEKVGSASRTHCPSYEVGVAGHTDSTPIGKNATRRLHPTNWHLSGARALAAMEYLVQHGGLRPAQVHFRGYGQHHPLASNATTEGRRRNRRIEIILGPPR